MQAFRVGEAAWGVQFHVEATADLVGEWARADGQSEAEITAAVRDAEGRLAEVGERFARRFAAFVAA
jgi:GMP synthase-like glutamine amidotransferase